MDMIKGTWVGASLMVGILAGDYLIFQSKDVESFYISLGYLALSSGLLATIIGGIGYCSNKKKYSKLITNN